MPPSRLTSALLAGSLLFSAAPSAFGATVEEVLQDQQTLQESASCGVAQGRSIGRCITDTLKRINELRDALKNAIADERNAWLDAHANLGATDEYRQQYQEFLETVSKQRKQFRTQEQVIRKQVFDQRKELRTEQQETQQVQRPTRAISSTDEQEATKQCSSSKNDAARRICLRLQLRLQGPAGSMRGGVR